MHQKNLLNKKNKIQRPSLFALGAIGAIQGYRMAISPFLGDCCRFFPSCSEYAIAALRTYGIWKGLALAIRRIAKCHPFHRGGLDPLPVAERAELEEGIKSVIPG